MCPPLLDGRQNRVGFRFARVVIQPVCLLLLCGSFAGAFSARADAMLQLFNVNWGELIQKMPEIAEAGYTSLWLPPPGKGGSGYSVGYDLFDPFDLGDKDQRGTVPTRYGSKAELLRMVEMAHRFGVRVYFDNIVNHRAFDVPGYNAFAPPNVYPGLWPGDFHLRLTPDGFYRNANNISDWSDVWKIQNCSLGGLVDIAHESPNQNFGLSEGSTAAKPVFIRQPGNPEYYPDTRLPVIAGAWHPFNGTNGVPVAEDVNSYLIRSVMWLLSETKCDGFRLDAVKHVPGYFFGDYGASTANGYCGGIQTMFDGVHGYGNNVLGNGYVEGDDNRNSCFDAEAVRNDALIFGEHLGEPPSYDDYLKRGMRLLDNPIRNNLNNILGNPGSSLAGYEQRDAGGFGAADRVMHAQSHDNGYAARRELQNAFYFFREGIPLIYSDGYNQSTSDGNSDPFPRVAYAPYLGEYNDNKMPDLAYLHNQLARGGTRGRWGDSDIVAFERYDYREGSGSAPQDQTVVLFAMNDNYGYPGDISFDDGVAQTTDGTYYECFPVANSRGQGLVVGFPPGSVLAQLADSPGHERACAKLLVRKATNSRQEAIDTRENPDPIERKVYVGSQALAPNGGAIEVKIPSGGYVAYAYQGPQASPASQRDVITFRHGGVEVPRMTFLRTDGRDGDSGFNPLYPFKMRGSLDSAGNVVRGQHVTNRTYAIDIPIVTNAPLEIVVRPDASTMNVLVKLDGGMDVNSQLSLGPTNGFDRRDNRPGYSTDVFLGYEQALYSYRRGPEKFGSTNIDNNNIVSAGAETFRYTVGGSSSLVVGSGGGLGIKTSTADWVYHEPTAAVYSGPATQRTPLIPADGQPVTNWVKVGYQNQINTGKIYYTTDGSNPEGSFGSGRGTTLVADLVFDHNQTGDPKGTLDWWRGVIPAQPAGTVVKYKVALYKDGISPISDADSAKLYGVTRFAITGFNPQNATIWLHNDLNPSLTQTGLQEGFHIVRARAFLPRDGKSSVFNTFLQTFYYDASVPNGAVAFPGAGETLRSRQYGVVVRADATTTEAEYNISDSNPANDDSATGLRNGNGLSNGVPVWVKATLVSPSGSISAQYPALPQEFRFNYLAVPSDSNATLTVRLKKATTAVYTNRYNLITRTVATRAPEQTLDVSFPDTDGQTIFVGQNSSYTLVFRFSDVLTADVNLFLVRIDGAVQPRLKTDGSPNYYFSDWTPGDGKNELRLDWAGMGPGQHVVEVFFNGDALALQATRIVNVQFNGVAVNILRPAAADEQGRSPVTISIPPNTPPATRQYTVTTETTPAVTNVFISFTPTNGTFSGGSAVLDTNFTGSARHWDFVWTNFAAGVYTIRADALGGGSNTALRVVQVQGYTLVTPVHTNDTFSFGLQALSGVTYVIQFSDSLTTPNWRALTNIVGDATLRTIRDTVPGITNRFYRFYTL